MKSLKIKPLWILAILLIFTGYSTAQKAGIKISTEEEIKSDVSLVPCKDKERLAAVKSLFIKNGATEPDITIEKLKDVENLIVTKKGKTAETVIVGAHYDKTPEGCGAIDNWTGIVVLANLYRTMKDLTTEKTYLFVAFGKEEQGLIGSDAMAGRIPKEERTNYCAMVNFDSFGFTYPQALRNISDTSLIKLAEETSKEMNIPFADAGIDFASSDSQSFRNKKIPAISLHGLSNNWTNYLHTASDKVSNIKIGSVHIGYRHGLVFLSKIDRKPCGSFRK